MDDQCTLLVVGAHPDDCSIKAGGIAAKYVEAGHDVTFLSVTDGGAGHHEMDRDPLVARRRAETEAVAETLGIEYDVFDIEDGRLEPTLENRRRLVRYVREVDPDLVLGPRPNDYHPDHRYCAQLLRDAAYTLIVPNICPDTPALSTNPVFGYVADHFEKPAPFEPDVVIDVTDVEDRKIDALHCHESQMYEWLPYTYDELEAVPEGDAERREWLAGDGLSHLEENTEMNVADRFREALIDRYGPERGRAAGHAEAVEISEYGASLTDSRREELFFF
ncbi:PIG-L deacetylase family protein [Natrarchaeobius chitinivorans]|uniref:PIG-L family deacetylase n=1 Tax=Natrarchaeobius chitinivorans TaxID=1679083 RepID=A0A3N6MCI7_NATCH|nr:PIG-L family deacetylase [Natrarchaeobius chitinivorans]RQG94250.1 PIG-L family deacetylase [Natrarchaeobius chitinivorans]